MLDHCCDTCSCNISSGTRSGAELLQAATTVTEIAHCTQSADNAERLLYDEFSTTVHNNASTVLTIPVLAQFRNGNLILYPTNFAVKVGNDFDTTTIA